MTTGRCAGRVVSLVSGGLLSVGLAFTASAQLSSSGLTTRVWAGAVGRYVLTDNDPFSSPSFGTVELKVNGSGPGVGADGEYKFDRWIGLDAAIAYSRLNVQFTTSTAPGAAPTQTLGVAPALLALNLHPISTERVDVWGGPQIGYVMFPNDLSYSVNSGSFSYKPKSVFSKKGFDVGADVAFTKRAIINAAMRWQDADGDSDGHLTVDPAFVTLGFTWKY